MGKSSTWLFALLALVGVATASTQAFAQPTPATDDAADEVYADDPEREASGDVGAPPDSEGDAGAPAESGDSGDKQADGDDVDLAANATDETSAGFDRSDDVNTAAAIDEDGTATNKEDGGVRYVIEGVELRGNQRTANRVILRYIQYRAGDVLDVNDPALALTRYRLLGTGFFSSVQLSLRRGSKRGHVVLLVDVVERNTFIVQNLWMGVAADENEDGDAEPITAFVGLRAAETNLAGSGITLGAGVGVAADQFSIRTDFADPSFFGSDWTAAASVYFLDGRDFFGNRDVLFESPFLEQREVTDYAVVAYTRFGGSVGTGHDLTVSTRFNLDYRLEQVDATVPQVASHLRGDEREPIEFDILPAKSALSTLSASFTYDTRDTPILPTRGWLASTELTVGLKPIGSEYSFQRLELSAQHWWRLPWRHVVRAELFAGGIAGDAPFFEQYYVGDFTDLLPDRVLGLNPDRRRPPNFLDTAIVEVRYGEFAAKLEGEYRIPLYRGRGSIFGIDLFSAVGLYAVATDRDFEDPASGYDGLRRVPMDLSYNLGLKVDTSIGGVTFAFSNLLGLLPTGSGER